mmetsp:Transcript_17954/g.30151  ORF Transcript_17954/g.30151 Transcript_17954/m.30151 type:complete len:215 (+) Transcript_17954:209-853(+)
MWNNTVLYGFFIVTFSPAVLRKTAGIETRGATSNIAVSSLAGSIRSFATTFFFIPTFVNHVLFHFPSVFLITLGLAVYKLSCDISVYIGCNFIAVFWHTNDAEHNMCMRHAALLILYNMHNVHYRSRCTVSTFKVLARPQIVKQRGQLTFEYVDCNTGSIKRSLPFSNIVQNFAPSWVACNRQEKSWLSVFRDYSQGIPTQTQDMSPTTVMRIG